MFKKVLVGAGAVGLLYLLLGKKGGPESITSGTPGSREGGSPARSFRDQIRRLGTYVPIVPSGHSDNLREAVEVERIVERRYESLSRNIGSESKGYTLTKVVLQDMVPWQGPNDKLWYGFVKVWVKEGADPGALMFPITDARPGEFVNTFTVKLQPVYIPNPNMASFSNVEAFAEPGLNSLYTPEVTFQEVSDRRLTLKEMGDILFHSVKFNGIESVDEQALNNHFSNLAYPDEGEA